MFRVAYQSEPTGGGGPLRMIELVRLMAPARSARWQADSACPWRPVWAVWGAGGPTGGQLWRVVPLPPEGGQVYSWNELIGSGGQWRGLLCFSGDCRRRRQV